MTIKFLTYFYGDCVARNFPAIVISSITVFLLNLLCSIGLDRFVPVRWTVRKMVSRDAVTIVIPKRGSFVGLDII